jgi:hypothetical protein
MKRSLMLVTLVALAGAAQAGQAIYRCGQTYSQTPCPDGKIVESTDPRTAAQRAEAKRVAVKEKQLAAKMERERKEREAASAPQGAASLSAPAAAEPASSPASKPKAHKGKPKKKTAAANKDFTAIVPGSKQKS